MENRPGPGVLFVDDDRQLLKSLKRMLGRKLRGWTLRFADSADQAMKSLDEGTFHAVVTDILMPGMDGIELLDLVRRRHPLTARIILSGASGDRDAMDAVEVAHQYLSKPCDQDGLVRVLAEAATNCGMGLDAGFRAGIACVGLLPCLAGSLEALRRELAGPTPSVARLGAVAAGDPGLAANVLKLVSSPFFGFSRSGVGPEQAVAMLGVKTMARIVVERDLFPEVDPDSDMAAFLPGLWRHCRACGRMAARMAKMEGLDGAMVESVRTAALLHDLGKLVLALKFPEMSRGLLEAVRGRNRSVHDLERAGRVDHARAGAYLLGLWGCGGPVMSAVGRHHQPGMGQGHDLATALVHAANRLEHELVVINKGYAVNPLDMDFLEKAGLAGRLPSWRRECEAVAAEEETGGA